MSGGIRVKENQVFIGQDLLACKPLGPEVSQDLVKEAKELGEGGMICYGSGYVHIIPFLWMKKNLFRDLQNQKKCSNVIGIRTKRWLYCLGYTKVVCLLDVRT